MDKQELIEKYKAGTWLTCKIEVTGLLTNGKKYQINRLHPNLKDVEILFDDNIIGWAIIDMYFHPLGKVKRAIRRVSLE